MSIETVYTFQPDYHEVEISWNRKVLYVVDKSTNEVLIEVPLTDAQITKLLPYL